MYEIETMTLPEYQLAMEAYAIKQTLRREDIAMQAWFNQTVQATKGSDKHPKPRYKNFKEFYNTEEQEDEIRAQFEPDYTSKFITKKREQQLIQERFEKLQELKQKRKGGN
ncbi:hypothetical protein HMPREF0877_0856 [Weissella paramesenteroides ATCC 33313]|uniref:Uncharacterized protein n=2 Tax=Weissella paramesenteroides TaxID=1249 RepID=C5RA61_WEIPA|nr:hypothetical protein HMPREF0877_0856 [Weissella paramesenteroides ATCC 33313]